MILDKNISKQTFAILNTNEKLILNVKVGDFAKDVPKDMRWFDFSFIKSDSNRLIDALKYGDSYSNYITITPIPERIEDNGIHTFGDNILNNIKECLHDILGQDIIDLANGAKEFGKLRLSDVDVSYYEDTYQKAKELAINDYEYTAYYGCVCHDHILRLEVCFSNNGKKLEYIILDVIGEYNRSIMSRIKYAWRVLKGEGPFGDQITLAIAETMDLYADICKLSEMVIQ